MYKRKCKCRVQGGKVQGAGGRMPEARCQVQQGRCPPMQILGKRNSEEHPFARSASPGQATGDGWKWVLEYPGFRRLGNYDIGRQLPLYQVPAPAKPSF
ncbi:hypothetical protein FVEG_06969 [Fusarium verticillioides 7600]|uniref:Uncharacterized protein n=1 Tax=Gibberella moniliformis (strain M3125 / FGSC 7600) TaxID=334819 RepID=W7MPF7_GIBM7|nr:hypothetical protein FVEG_06969 [Fusarium verticillioides 7600]EWG46502.1 hypothetical protein FVEG_06969 [Fusarium verticillioides 7600]